MEEWYTIISHGNEVNGLRFFVNNFFRWFILAIYARARNPSFFNDNCNVSWFWLCLFCTFLGPQVYPFLGRFRARNIMFVPVLAATRTTLLVDLWLVCQTFQGRKMLKTDGVSKKMGCRDASLPIPCGYWIALLSSHWLPFLTHFVAFGDCTTRCWNIILLNSNC